MALLPTCLITSRGAGEPWGCPQTDDGSATSKSSLHCRGTGEPWGCPLSDDGSATSYSSHHDEALASPGNALWTGAVSTPPRREHINATMLKARCALGHEVMRDAHNATTSKRERDAHKATASKRRRDAHKATANKREAHNEGSARRTTRDTTLDTSITVQVKLHRMQK